MISQIPQADRGRFEQIIRQFRERWHAEFSGPTVANHFENCLPPKTDPLRRAVLLEIVAIDLVTRIQLGQQVSLQSYLDDIDELGPNDRLPASLLFVEYSCRQKSADPISAEAFAALYPTQAAQFMELVQEYNLRASPARSGTLVCDPLVDSLTIQPIGDSPGERSPRDSKVDSRANKIDKVDNREPTQDLWSTLPKPADRIVSVGGGYRMIRKIGQGNFGEVWLSEAPGGVEVALKIVRIPPGQKTKHLEMRSLDLMKRLRHPFLMQVQAFWVSEEQILIAMELADYSLRDRARQSGSDGMSLPELLRYMTEAAEGIDYLHREHVVHRDIKPENLLLLKGHIKVADFGLARFMDESGLTVVATQVAGSPLYMAPEVWTGKPVTSSDQYSLAMTYAELRLGRAPFSATSMVSVMQEHLYGQPQLGGLAESEQAVLRIALSKHPNDRYRNCSEMVQALVDATRKVDTPEPPPKRNPAKLVVWGVSAALALLSGVVLIEYKIDRQTAKPSSSPKAVAIILNDEVSVAYGQGNSLVVVTTDMSETVELIQPKNVPPGVSLIFNPSEKLLKVSADLNARVGTSEVPLMISTSGGENISKTLRISVVDAKNLWLPPRAQPTDVNSRRVDLEGRVLYERIAYALPSGDRIEFQLIRRTGTADPPTFYIMKQEVTNRWFAAFASANPKQIAPNAPWRQGALAGTKHLGCEGPFLDYPVVLVNVEEAIAFAKWIGGMLPTGEQWDKAAGANEQQRWVGPYREGGSQICVDRMVQGPLPGASSLDDVSALGVHDLAGNVKELTRSILNSTLLAPLEDRLGNEKIILRGSGYFDVEPWRFDRLDDSMMESFPYDDSKPDIGFRVVIEF